MTAYCFCQKRHKVHQRHCALVHGTLAILQEPRLSDIFMSLCKRLDRMALALPSLLCKVERSIKYIGSSFDLDLFTIAEMSRHIKFLLKSCYLYFVFFGSSIFHIHRAVAFYIRTPLIVST